MSTKIYNGYKFNNNPNLLEIQRICLDIRNRVKPLANQLYYRQFIKEMVDVYDKNQFGYWEESMYFINIASNMMYWGIDRYLHERIKYMNYKQERDPEVDFGLKFTILPLKDRQEVLLLLYTEKKELREAFEATPEIDEYHYQNQTDQPEEISEEAWNQRRLDWNSALGGDGWSTPQECGFLYEPYDSNRLSFFGMEKEEKKQLTSLFPDLDTRAKKIVTNLMGTKWDANNPIDALPDNATKKQKDKQYRDCMDRYWAFNDYCRSEDGQKEKAIKMVEVIPQLRIFTFEELADLKLEFHEKIKDILNKPEGGKPYWYKD